MKEISTFKTLDPEGRYTGPRQRRTREITNRCLQIAHKEGVCYRRIYTMERTNTVYTCISRCPRQELLFMNNYTKFIFTLKVHLYLDNYSPFRRSRPNKGRTMQVDSSHLGCVVRVTSTSGSQKFRKIWTLLDICKQKGITSLKYLHC